MLFTIPALLLASLALAAPAAVDNQSTLAKRAAADCKAHQQYSSSAKKCVDCGPFQFNSAAEAQSGKQCQDHTYARFSGYDFDSGDHNAFFGTSPDWTKSENGPVTNGAEANVNDGAITEGNCERKCITTFPNLANSPTGFSGLVYVPVNNDPLAQMPFQCWCKSDKASPTLLYPASQRVSILLGHCSDFTQFVVDSKAANGGNPTCEDVTYNDIGFSGSKDKSCSTSAGFGKCAPIV